MTQIHSEKITPSSNNYQININLDLSDNVSDKLSLIEKELGKIHSQAYSLKSSLQTNTKDTSTFADKATKNLGILGGIMSGLGAMGGGNLTA